MDSVKSPKLRTGDEQISDDMDALRHHVIKGVGGLQTIDTSVVRVHQHGAYIAAN